MDQKQQDFLSLQNFLSSDFELLTNVQFNILQWLDEQQSELFAKTIAKCINLNTIKLMNSFQRNYYKVDNNFVSCLGTSLAICQKIQHIELDLQQTLDKQQNFQLEMSNFAAKLASCSLLKIIKLNLSQHILKGVADLGSAFKQLKNLVVLSLNLSYDNYLEIILELIDSLTNCTCLSVLALAFRQNDKNYYTLGNGEKYNEVVKANIYNQLALVFEKFKNLTKLSLNFNIWNAHEEQDKPGLQFALLNLCHLSNLEISFEYYYDENLISTCLVLPFFKTLKQLKLDFKQFFNGDMLTLKSLSCLGYSIGKIENLETLKLIQIYDQDQQALVYGLMQGLTTSKSIKNLVISPASDNPSASNGIVLSVPLCQNIQNLNIDLFIQKRHYALNLGTALSKLQNLKNLTITDFQNRSPKNILILLSSLSKNQNIQNLVLLLAVKTQANDFKERLSQNLYKMKRLVNNYIYLDHWEEQSDDEEDEENLEQIQQL
ncbi:hypothetical protein ABPG74_006732 [Tetrahymena malaccensis]